VVYIYGKDVGDKEKSLKPSPITAVRGGFRRVWSLAHGTPNGKSPNARLGASYGTMPRSARELYAPLCVSSFFFFLLPITPCAIIRKNSTKEQNGHY